MIDRRQKIGETADLRRQLHLNTRDRNKQLVCDLARLRRMALVQPQKIGQARAQRGYHPVARPHQGVEASACCETRSVTSLAVQKTNLQRGQNIEDLVADRDPDARAGNALENAKGEVLNRKIAAREVGAFDPALARRVMRAIQTRHPFLPVLRLQLNIPATRNSQTQPRRSGLKFI
jgi:hypothetical protein